MFQHYYYFLFKIIPDLEMGGPGITRKTQMDIDNIMREKQTWLLNMFCWQIIREDCLKSDHVSLPRS